MIELRGIWSEGFAYDVHTIKSVCTDKKNEYGHPIFDTTRSQMGEYVYQLKYKQDLSTVTSIIELLKQNQEFNNLIKNIDIIIPVPPSNKIRTIQPVFEVSKEIAKSFNKELNLNAIKSTNIEQVKNIDDRERLQKVKQSITIDNSLDAQKSILLFDDIFDSGSTLQAITEILMEKGFKDIKIFTLTKAK